MRPTSARWPAWPVASRESPNGRCSKTSEVPKRQPVSHNQRSKGHDPGYFGGPGSEFLPGSLCTLGSILASEFMDAPMKTEGSRKCLSIPGWALRGI